MRADRRNHSLFMLLALAAGGLLLTQPDCKKDASRDRSHSTDDKKSATNASAASPKKAKSQAKRVIQQKVLLARARQALEENKQQQALTLLEKATQVLPGNAVAAEAYRRQGVILEAQGELQRALAALGQAHAIQPKNGDILHHMALINENLGQPRRAQQLMQKAVAQAPQRLAVLADMARVALAGGKQKMALRYLKHYETRRDALLQNLSAAKEQRVLEALAALRAVPDPETARKTTTCLSHRSPRVRRRAAQLLGAFRYRTSRGPLARAARTEKNKKVKTALRAALKHIERNPRQENIRLREAAPVPGPDQRARPSDAPPEVR
jgi:tetratricopeptide (TPR) repeat protein